MAILLILFTVNTEFEESYKLTVGLDFMIVDIEIDEEDIPKETNVLIKDSVKFYKKNIKIIRKLEDQIPDKPEISGVE